MKFLCVTHFYEGHGGGIERVAGYLNRQIAALGHEMSWAASGADALPQGEHLQILALDCVDPLERLTGLPMPIPLPPAAAKLWRAVRRGDAVIIHDALYITSIAAMIFAALARKPVVLIQHIAGIEFANPLLRQLMRLANRLVTRPMLRAADQVVFISDTVRREFGDIRLKRPERLLFNGVDGRRFHPDADNDGGDILARFYLPRDGKTALFVGRFVEKKGLSILHALARLRPDIRFALVGGGPVNPAQWGLPNVSLLGPQPPEVVASLYRVVDVLLLPSVGEGYPLVIQEAMACGLPVICGAQSALADPGASQWLHGVEINLADAPGSAERMAVALDRPGPDAQERMRMAAYAAATYSWQHMAKEIVALSQNLSGHN